MIAGCSSAAFGVTALLGWTFNPPALQDVLPWYLSIKVNTALVFVLLGTATALLGSGSRGRAVGRISLACAVIACLMSLATLMEYALGRNLGIDQAFLRDTTLFAADPGRMAPNTAAGFVLVSVALICLPQPRLRASWPFQALVLLPAWISIQALIGYTYGIRALYGVMSFNHMAQHTAFGMGILSIGVLWMSRKHGFMGLLLGKTPAGSMMRRLVPAAIFVPSLLGALILLGRSALGYDTTFGFSLLTVGCIALFTVQVWFTGAAFDRSDRKRREAEEGLVQSHQELEKRVQTRTAELYLLNEKLNRENAERRVVEDRIRTTNHALENAVEGISRFDPDGIYVNANTAHAALLGFTPGDLVGRNWLDAISKRDRATAKELYWKMVDNGRATAELRALHRDGQEVFLEITLSALRDSNGEFLGNYCFLKDISERVRTGASLAEAHAQALAASKAKSEFLASISHEIRTPMNAILGMADMLAETELEPQQQEYLRVLRRAGGNLLSLIDGVLDLSKIEAGRMELSISDVDLRELIHEVREVLIGKAQEKGISLEQQIDPKVPGLVRGDAGRLRQLILNLVGNAVKFTERGAVRVTVSNEQDGSQQNLIRISISDTGIGIQPEKLEAVFEDFTQVDASITRTYGGSGLGLAISRRLVHLMGGQIHVTSTLGEGSTFWFVLPLPAAETAREEATPISAIPPVPVSEALVDPTARPRLLLADDSEDNRLLIRAYLKALPYQVDYAENGLAAVAKFEQEEYDLVFMDLEMPEMDGYTATRVIREWERQHERRRTPILALTAHALSDVEDKCRDAGCDAHITKPVKKSTLLEAISNHLASREAASPVVRS